MKYVISIIMISLVAVGLAYGVQARDAAAPAKESSRVIEQNGTRVTFLGISKGFAFLDADDSRKAGSKQVRFLQACFLVEGKGGVRTFEVSGINGKIDFAGSTSEAIQADVGKSEWNQFRVEKIPDSTNDQSAIFQETLWNVKSVPSSVNVSLKLGEKQFVFHDVQP